MAASKKPSLGAVAAKADTEPPESGTDLGEYDAAVDEFLEVIGVSEDKLDEAREAFKAAVASCM